jgi:molybdopterin-biosynthesis enzyme MoeA-like protein
MKYAVLVIGDEILSGRRKDRHLDKAIELLTARGEQLSWAHYLGDDAQSITDFLRRSFCKDVIVFSFGGIGATPDDLTRQCAADAANRELVRHPEARQLIESRFGEEAYPKRILMADLPKDCKLIPNPYNQIPGFSIDQHHFLPGFPVMAHPMMQWVLDTHYPKVSIEDYLEKQIYVHNAPESELIDLMQQMLDTYPQVKLFSLPLHSDAGIRTIELGLKGKEADVNLAMQHMQSALGSLQYTWTFERQA